MIGLIVLCVIIGIIGLISSKHNLLSPTVLTATVWVVIFSLFLTLKHSLPDPTTQFISSISIWIIAFSIASLFAQSLNYNIKHYEPSELIRQVFFVISIAAFPFFIMFVREALMTGTSGEWTTDLRLAALGKTKRFTEIYDGWHIIFWQVTYIIELFYFKKSRKHRLIVIGLIILSYGFFTMSKMVFLELFFKTAVILFFKNKVKIKYFFMGLITLIVVFIGMQSIRHATDVDAVDKNDFFVLYLLSSTSAFDTLQPESGAVWGENVFRFFYAVANKIGISETEPIETILPFVHKPIYTNTYTIMYPFFVDFGSVGILVAAILYGFLFGWVFKKAQLGSEFFMLLFATLAITIALQYVAEVFITNFAGFIKQIILLSLPFLATKYKFFYFKKELK